MDFEPYTRYHEEQDARVADLENLLADVATWLYHYLATHEDKTAGALLYQIKGVLNAR